MKMSYDSNDDFNELYENVKKYMYDENFFESAHIEYEGRFLDIVKHLLMIANDDDLLSELLLKAIKIYRDIEINDAIESLSENGLIRMVVDENGKLGYEINFKD
jgi:hypothetical protein